MMIMKNVKIDADCPGTIMVGDVIIHITRITDSRLTIGVDAPQEQKITTSWPRKAKPVE
jgi:hypothetical protein